MFVEYLRTFGPRHQPYMTRQSYVHERWSAFLLPSAIGLVDATVVGILARKTFSVTPVMFAIIMAAPMFANVTSFVWARMARGQAKIPAIVLLMVATLACVASISLLPVSPLGAALLTLLIVIARCLLAGVVTVRSTVWRMNYPRLIRGQITGRLTLISSVALSVIPLIGYAVLDQNPQAFRIVYPVAVVMAMVGVYTFSRVRLRGQKELLRFERGPDAELKPHGTPAPIYEYDPPPERQSVKPTFWSILRQDHLFRQYMIYQFLLGSANMAATTVLVYIVAEMTEQMANGYTISIAITTTIPMLLAMMTLPLWARHLDNVTIARFRVRHSAVFILSHLLTFVGATTGLLPLIAVGQMAQGTARGGAFLAWNLGHNDFAARHLVALYMGIHVTLTGVRGAIAPFLAMALYSGWQPRKLPFGEIELPGFEGIGSMVFAVCAVVTVFAGIGFHLLDRQMGKSKPSLEA